ncbi:MAG: YkgJ family cysteine cluster protein [Candidatus Aminicenantales bacterium]
MTPTNKIPPEQALCRSCGLCCDGTLFAWVPLKTREKDFTGGPVTAGPAEGQFKFKLPCRHHRDDICQIYQAVRPEICLGFKCKLMHRYHGGGLSFDQAAPVIKEKRCLSDRAWSFPGDGSSVNRSALYAAWEEG